MQVRHLLPHLSYSALGAVINLAKVDALDGLPSSTRAWRGIKGEFLQDTPYGPMLATLDLKALPPHKDRSMVVVNPFACLHTAFAAEGGFHRMLKAKLITNG